MRNGYQPKTGGSAPSLTPSGGSAGRQDNPEIKFLGDLQRLSLKPGDKLVLSVDAFLSVDQRERLASLVKGFFGDTPVLILERGMTLAAVGSDVDIAA